MQRELQQCLASSSGLGQACYEPKAVTGLSEGHSNVCFPAQHLAGGAARPGPHHVSQGFCQGEGQGESASAIVRRERTEFSTWPTWRMALEVLAKTGWAFTDQGTPRESEMTTVPLLVAWMLHGGVPRFVFPKSNTALPLALLMMALQFCAGNQHHGEPGVLPKEEDPCARPK